MPKKKKKSLKWSKNFETLNCEVVVVFNQETKDYCDHKQLWQDQTVEACEWI
jgi:hypothetical protein